MLNEILAQIQSIVITAVSTAAITALTTILCALASIAWHRLKDSISDRRFRVFTNIVDPIISATASDPKSRAKWEHMFLPESDGGRWPTQAELLDFSREVVAVAKPQLSRLRGFAIDRAEEEVVARVRAFFVVVRAKANGNAPAGTTDPPAAGPTIGPDDEAQ